MKKLLRLWILFPLVGLTLNCHSSRSAGDHAAAIQTAAKVKDPVCGMEVDPSAELKIEHGGRTYYFCSKECKTAFEKNPSQYAEAPKK